MNYSHHDINTGTEAGVLWAITGPCLCLPQELHPFNGIPPGDTASSRVRSCRISKQTLASPVRTIMVVWLLGHISDDGSYPGKTGCRHMSRPQWRL
ncbi:hypothetical protein AVEN_96059-1 [Araneus ventricosus]|uniref:Uncharacterized protein n=1 Tax=Araneus ventricosus TaxID=182803 RepID=A0A4Y2B5U4_ARAVE|nr:hypothetical protein AVEN_96059-1 [Araneus ventricosus]